MTLASIGEEVPDPLRAMLARVKYLFKYTYLYRLYARRWGLRQSSNEGEFAEGTNPKLTVLVRIRNEDFWIELILRTLSKFGDELQVIVVDSGSQDKTKQIVEYLRREPGCKLDFFEHEEKTVSNPINNLILERAARAPYFYIVDGDDIQLESSIKKLLCVCGRRSTTTRYCVHYRHFQRAGISLVSRLYADSAKVCIGRVFKRDVVRFSRYSPLDSLEKREGITQYLISKLFNRQQNFQSEFVEDAYVLHGALLQRSTLTEWSGYASIKAYERLATDHLKARETYVAVEEDLVPLDIFPKEVSDLKYSDHNPYLKELRKMTGVHYE